MNPNDATQNFSRDRYKRQLELIKEQNRVNNFLSTQKLY